MADAQPVEAEGAALEQKVRERGFGEDEIQSWKGDLSAKLQARGYGPQELDQFWGNKKPDFSALDQHIKDNVASDKAKEAEKPPESRKEAGTLMEQLESGWQTSVSGLDLRKKLPDIDPNKHASYAMQMAHDLGQFAGDFPYMVVGGGAAGFAAGIATGGVGAIPAAGAGAFALPAAMRRILMDHYEKGDIKDPSDFASRMVSTAWDATKQGVVGALTAGVGSLVKPVAGALPALAAEIGTMTTAAAAVEGHLPHADDFLHTAVMVGGLHAAMGGIDAVMPKKFMNIYAKTGEKPGDVAQAMPGDVKLNQEMQAENPDIPKQAAVEPPPEEAPEEKEPTGTDLEKKFDAYIGKLQPKGKAPLAERVSEGFDQAYADHMDFTQAMGAALKEINANPTAEENPQILARLHASHMDTLQEFLEKGTRDFKTGERNGESFKSVMDEVDDHDAFKRFGIASRVLELAKRGMETKIGEDTVDVDEAKQIVSEGKEKYQALLDRKVAFGNRVLQYAHDSGYWEPGQFKAMIDQNKAHFSFHRVMEPDDFTGGTPGNSRGVKRIFGEGGLLQDPIVSTVKDTNMLLKMAEENNIKRALVKQVALTDAEGTPTDAALLRKVDTGMTPIKIDAKELNTGLKKQGIELNDQTLEGMTVFRPQYERLGPNRLEIYEDGKRQVYEGPSELIDSVNRLKGNPQVMGALSGMLKGAAAMERIGTVGTPWFAMKHAWRNQTTAGIYSQTGLKPFIDFMRYAPSYFMQGKGLSVGGLEIIKPRPSYDNFFFDGAAISSIRAFDDQWVQSKIFKLNKDNPFMDKVWNNTETAAQLSHWMILNHDNILRFGEYDRGLQRGMSRTDAAFAAREVLPDFQKAGLQNAFLFQQTAFLRVHLQGLDRMKQGVQEDVQDFQENGINKDNNMIRAIKYVALPTLLLAAANHGDKDIENLEPFQRYGYFNLAINRWKDATLAEAMAYKGVRDDLIRQKEDGSWQVNNKMIARLQKPFTTGIVFGGVVDAAMEAFRKNDPSAFKDYLWQVAGSTAAVPIPNFASAPIAQMDNYEAFTGRPVVTLAKEKLLPEMQYDSYTSQTARTIGKVMQAIPFGVGDTLNQIGPQGRKLTSPMVVDMYIRETTGTLGQIAVTAIDKVLEKSGVGPVPNEPASQWTEYPIAREFFWRNPTMRAASIVEFEDRYKQSDSIHASMMAAEKQNDPATAIKLQEKYQTQMMRLQGPYEAMRNISHMVQGLRLDPTMDPVQKRQLTDQYMYRANQIAESANKTMDDFEKQVKNVKQGSNP